MSLFSLLNPALTIAHSAVTAVAPVLQPVFGGGCVAVALIVLTLIVRAMLLPFAVSVLHADRVKRALVPELTRLRARHGSDSARLARELQAAYRAAGISPLAGMLPALAQSPVLLVVYRLCVVPIIAGAPNTVLSASLFGAPLAVHGPAVLATGGLLSAPGLTVLGLMLALLAVAVLTARQLVQRVRDSSVGDVPASQLLVVRVMPFATVVVAMMVPLAVSLYLLTSTTWSLAERAVLPRLF